MFSRGNEQGFLSLLILGAILFLSSLSVFLLRSLLDQYDVVKTIRKVVKESVPERTTLRENDHPSRGLVYPDWSMLQKHSTLPCPQARPKRSRGITSFRTCQHQSLPLSTSSFLAGNLEVDSLLFSPSENEELVLSVTGSLRVGSQILIKKGSSVVITIIAGGAVSLGHALPEKGKISVHSLGEYISIDALSSQNLLCPEDGESTLLSLELLARKGVYSNSPMMHWQSPLGCRFFKDPLLWPSTKVIGISSPRNE